MMHVILANGMPRSGSTWLYNATRYALSQIVPSCDLVCGWHTDISNRGLVNVLKVHGIDQQLLKEATQIVYSYRDIRDVMASRMRMWGRQASIHMARNLVAECSYFEKHADFVMRYEDMLVDPERIVHGLVKALAPTIGDNSIEIGKVMEDLASEKKPASEGKPYNKEDLYHIGHVTSGKHMDFHGVVPPEVIRQTESEFGSWFTDRGYILETK